MQEDTSKSMNTSAFSCGVSGATLHEAGKLGAPVRASAVTWKSLKTRRPHWSPAPPSGCAAGLTGVLKVMCCTEICGGVSLGFGFQSHRVEPTSTPKRSCLVWCKSRRVDPEPEYPASTLTNH